MDQKEITDEQLFAMVWGRPTRQVAKEFGVSDVAIAMLCARLQVPKPPRGYWARVQSGRIPMRPPLNAFREMLERRRQEDVRTRAAGILTALQREFYDVAITELTDKGIDVAGAQLRGGQLSDVRPDISAQILLLIQNRGQSWVEQGKVPTRWVFSVERSAAGLVERLLSRAQTQVLLFEGERRNGSSVDRRCRRSSAG